MRGEQQRYLVPCPAVPGITPACAGSSSGNSFPRRDVRGSPPHARGAGVWYSASWEATGITPACAGSSSSGYSRESLHRDHPRMRGEQFTRLAKPFREQGSPPHARGAAAIPGDPGFLVGITPACAGSSSGRCSGRSGSMYARADCSCLM